LCPNTSPSPCQTVAPSDRLRFGIIGIGMQGSGLLHDALQLPGVECIAACDLYDGRHTLAREIVGKRILATRRYKDLLDNKEIDCLIAAVPDHWHKQVVVDAVSAGKISTAKSPCPIPPPMVSPWSPPRKNRPRRANRFAARQLRHLRQSQRAPRQRHHRTLTLVEGSLGRNDPTGAWEYPPPPDLSPKISIGIPGQGDVPKVPFNPNIFARWRCWKDTAPALAGDLLVHLVRRHELHASAGTLHPRRPMALGGILRFPDGRNMPDVHATLFDCGGAPVYLRLNLGCDTPEIYRFQGSKGILEVTEFTITYFPQSGEDEISQLLHVRLSASDARRPI